MHFYIRAVQIITSADEILSQALKKKKRKNIQILSIWEAILGNKK